VGAGEAEGARPLKNRSIQKVAPMKMGSINLKLQPYLSFAGQPYGLTTFRRDTLEGVRFRFSTGGATSATGEE